MAQITFKGETFELSTKLRVAFLIQKAHNHTPYTEVFNKVNGMAIEKQIEILWISFKTENEDYVTREGLTLQAFQNEIFENSNLVYMLEAIGDIVEGIMYHGMSEEEIETKKAQSLEEASKNPVGEKSSREDFE